MFKIIRFAFLVTLAEWSCTTKYYPDEKFAIDAEFSLFLSLLA